MICLNIRRKMDGLRRNASGLFIALTLFVPLIVAQGSSCQDMAVLYEGRTYHCSDALLFLSNACECRVTGEYPEYCLQFLAACPRTCNLCRSTSACQDTSISYAGLTLQCSHALIFLPNACECEATGAYIDYCPQFLAACPRTCNLCEQDSTTNCGGEYTFENGQLRSPKELGSSNYPHNTDCSWTITVDESYRVAFTFLSFDLEDSGGCIYDYVKLHDGRYESSPVLLKHCGEGLPAPTTIYSSGNKMYVHMHSDGSGSGTGFRAVFHSVCGGEYTTGNGQLNSPTEQGSTNYPHNTDCSWTITVDENQRIAFTFQTFDLEYSAGCTYDFVKLHDGRDELSPLLLKHCGEDLPAPATIYSSGNKMYVYMHSDNSMAGTGFTAVFNHVNPVCEAEYTSETGQLNSPTEPGSTNYPDNTDCAWTITVDENHRVAFTFQTFDLEASGGCVYDYVKLHDGRDESSPVLLKQCGEGLPAPATIYSTGHQMYVHMHSDGSVSKSGFAAVFNTAEADATAVHVTSPSFFSSSTSPSPTGTSSISILSAKSTTALTKADANAVHVTSPSYSSSSTTPSPTGKNSSILSAKSTTALNVRLVDGLASGEGNVEVFRSGRWGPICDDGWDITDGHVICKNLGYHHALGITRHNEFYSLYSPAQISNVRCLGNESNVLQCMSDIPGIYGCGFRNQAGVRCSYCNDLHEECDYLAHNRACESDTEILLICPRSCDFCSTPKIAVETSSKLDDCVTGHCYTTASNEIRCIPAVELCIGIDWIGVMLCIPTPNVVRRSFIKCMNFTERSKSEMRAEDIVDDLLGKLTILKRDDRYADVDQNLQGILAQLREFLPFINRQDMVLYSEEHIRDRQEFVTLLFFWRSGVSYIEDGAFTGLTNLRSLIIGEQILEVITEHTFDGLNKLEYLDIGTNYVHSVEVGSFSHMKKLLILDLKINSIVNLEPGVFLGLTKMTKLSLFANNLQTIKNGTFDDLENLRFLFLQYNNISRIEVGAFSDLKSLLSLNLSHNVLQYLSHGAFSGLESLQYLDLNYNQIARIDPFTNNAMKSLRFLFLLETELHSIKSNTLTSLTAVEKMATSDNRLCCQLNDNPNFVCAKTSQTKPLETCSRLFPNWALRIAGWVMGLSALVGNGVVLFLRLQDSDSIRTSKVQNAMIGSLAMADILMGVYMIIITSADIVYGDAYYLFAPKWRDSHLCRFAGFLGFLSSEASVFTLTLLTLDRFICVVFPFSKLKIREGSSKILVGVVWVLTMMMSLGLVIITSYRPDVYGLSDVCLGLPLHVETESTGHLQIQGGFFFEYQVQYVITDSSSRPPWLFSIIVFIGVNLVSILFILVCYIAIFIKTSRSAARVRSTKSQNSEKKLAIRVALIVATDVACWMPVIIMGILSQTGTVTLDPSLYAWTVILIVPINSSINPFLYTFLGYLDSRTKRQKKKQAHRNTNEAKKKPLIGQQSAEGTGTTDQEKVSFFQKFIGSAKNNQKEKQIDPIVNDAKEKPRETSDDEYEMTVSHTN